MVKLNQKLLFLLLLLGMALFIGSSFLMKPRVVEVISQPSQISTSTPEKEKSITIILAGDIMLDRGVEYMTEKYGGGNFEFPFLKIADEFQKADVVFGNLEGPISDKGEKVGSVYSFRADPRAIDGLNFAGFNILSLANNHAFDYGREALEDTLEKLKTAGINHVGAGFNEEESYSPVIKEINGTKIGFLAYTDLGSPYWTATASSSGIAWLTEEKLENIKEDIKLAKEKVDILIVSLHSGEEYAEAPAQFQIEFSKAAIDAGADLAVGHHPHVVQKPEIYNGKYIFYSLGNFIFDQAFSKETMEGQIVEILIENGKIKEVRLINTKINEFFQPEIVD